MPADTIHQGTGVTAKNTNAILVVSFLTFFFASLSFITGNRLSTLQDQSKSRMSQAAALDAGSREQMRNALDTVKQAHLEEKKKNDRIKKKIVTITKEMKVLKAELDNSKKRIEDLQSSPETVSSSTNPPPSPKSVEEIFSVSATKE